MKYCKVCHKLDIHKGPEKCDIVRWIRINPKLSKIRKLRWRCCEVFSCRPRMTHPITPRLIRQDICLTPPMSWTYLGAVAGISVHVTRGSSSKNYRCTVYTYSRFLPVYRPQDQEPLAAGGVLLHNHGSAGRWTCNPHPRYVFRICPCVDKWSSKHNSISYLKWSNSMY